MMDLLPTINKVFFLVLQQERQRGLYDTHSTVELVSLVVSRSDYQSKKSGPLCSQCGILGYIAEKCYKLHLYPTRLKFIDKSKPIVQAHMTQSSETNPRPPVALPFTRE